MDGAVPDINSHVSIGDPIITITQICLANITYVSHPSPCFFIQSLPNLPAQDVGQRFELSYTFEGLDEGVNALAISPDGHTLLSGCE